jgi:hypothetical protein
MAFIIRRTDQGGGYVAPAGSAKSYTKRRDRARQFPTYAAADADRCPGNEIIEEV